MTIIATDNFILWNGHFMQFFHEPSSASCKNQVTIVLSKSAFREVFIVEGGVEKKG